MSGYFLEWYLPVGKQLVPRRQDDDKRVLPNRLGQQPSTLVGGSLCESHVKEIFA